MHLTLKIVNGDVLEYDVLQNTCVIGRSAKCDVVVPHDGMSRQHCQIDMIDGEVFVTDLGSTNGVLIDGQKIEPHTKTPYATFLTLSFGAVSSLQIESDEAKSAASMKVNSSFKSETPSSSQKTTILKDPGKASATQTSATNPNTKITKGNKEEKAKSIFVNILAVAILAGAVYWAITKEDAPEESVESSAPAKPAGKTNNYDSF